MVSEQKASLSLGQRLSHLATKAAFGGGDMALRVPVLRNWVLGRLLRRLGTSYDDNEDDSDQHKHVRWTVSRLGPFLQRLIRERPSAARAILRFIGTYSDDMYHRSGEQRVGRVSPCTVVIEPTDRCNLSCPGCYAKSTHDGSDVSYEQMKRVVQEVLDMGVTLVTLSGGEPFMRERAERTLSRLGEAFPRQGFMVYTNGTLIDPETAVRLGKCGNVFPAISVEGYEHQTDARRGAGVYEQNRGVRRMLAEREVMVGFSATITRQNAEAIASDDFIDRRIEEGDLFGWFFILQPIGRSPRPDLMVTSDQRAMLKEAVWRWRQQNRPIFLGDFWNDGHVAGGCIAGGRYYFHIRANGDISPCVFAPVACGNIFDIIEGRSEYATLRDFVQNHPLFVAYRQEQKKITDRARPCLLIDSPDAFRRITQIEGCRPAKNMPPGYLDGDIAHAIDAAAEDWQRYCATQPASPIPAQPQPVESAAASATVG